GRAVLIGIGKLGSGSKGKTMATGRLETVLHHLRTSINLHGAEDRTDRQLLERAATGHDEGAFEAILRRHGPLVFGVCRRVLRNEHDAEDAFQATFLVLVQKAGSLERPEALSHWLYEVAYRTASR